MLNPEEVNSKTTETQVVNASFHDIILGVRRSLNVECLLRGMELERLRKMW